MFNVKDRPGCISKATMRGLFESAIKKTAALNDSTPLGTVDLNGEFHHYADPDTDTMWIGFAIGMRCAERLEQARAKGGATGVSNAD